MVNRSTAWRVLFQSLKQEFQRAADAHPRLQHFAVQPLGEGEDLPPHWKRAIRETDTVRGGLLTAPWDDRRESSHLFGPAAAVAAFERLAERAWLALPGTPAGKEQAY